MALTLHVLDGAPATPSTPPVEPGSAAGLPGAPIPIHRTPMICCGGFPSEHFDGCQLDRTPCRCETRLGCYPHGIEPRPAAVPCVGCHRRTWTIDRICERCYPKEVAS